MRELVINVQTGCLYVGRVLEYTLPNETVPGLTLTEWWVDILVRKWDYFKRFADCVLLFAPGSRPQIDRPSPYALADELRERGIPARSLTHLQHFFYDAEGNIYEAWSPIGDIDNIHRTEGFIRIDHYGVGTGNRDNPYVPAVGSCSLGDS